MIKDSNSTMKVFVFDRHPEILISFKVFDDSDLGMNRDKNDPGNICNVFEKNFLRKYFIIYFLCFGEFRRTIEGK